MGEIETVGAEKMGWLDLPRGTSYPTFPYLAKLPRYFWHDPEFYLGRFCILLHQTLKVVHAEGSMCARDAAPTLLQKYTWQKVR